MISLILLICIVIIMRFCIYYGREKDTRIKYPLWSYIMLIVIMILPKCISVLLYSLILVLLLYFEIVERRNYFSFFNKSSKINKFLNKKI